MAWSPSLPQHFHAGMGESSDDSSSDVPASVVVPPSSPLLDFNKWDVSADELLKPTNTAVTDLPFSPLYPAPCATVTSATAASESVMLPFDATSADLPAIDDAAFQELIDELAAHIPEGVLLPEPAPAQLLELEPKDYFLWLHSLRYFPPLHKLAKSKFTITFHEFGAVIQHQGQINTFYLNPMQVEQQPSSSAQRIALPNKNDSRWHALAREIWQFVNQIAPDVAAEWSEIRTKLKERDQKRQKRRAEKRKNKSHDGTGSEKRRNIE